MIREIVTDPAELMKPSYEVDCKRDWDGIKQVILDLKDTLREKGGLGLAGIQIGVNKRLFVINFNGDYKTFINPMIAKFSKPTWAVEQCLSCGDEKYMVQSFDEIEIYYQTPLGQNKSGRLRGLGARIFQHENNHLNGVTIRDHGLEWTEELDKLSEEEKQALFIEFAKQLADGETKMEKEEKVTDDNKQSDNK